MNFQHDHAVTIPQVTEETRGPAAASILVRWVAPWHHLFHCQCCSDPKCVSEHGQLRLVTVGEAGRDLLQSEANLDDKIMQEPTGRRQEITSKKVKLSLLRLATSKTCEQNISFMIFYVYYIYYLYKIYTSHIVARGNHLHLIHILHLLRQHPNNGRSVAVPHFSKVHDLAPQQFETTMQSITGNLGWAWLLELWNLFFC